MGHGLSEAALYCVFLFPQQMSA